MPSLPRTRVPPLRPGDHLTRPEFARRLEALPPDTAAKAELVNGVVYMMLSIRAEHHGYPAGLLVTWLNVYAAATPGVRAYTEATLRLDLDNELRPDALLRIEAGCGGQSRITDDDYISGPPELVVEVAASSAAYDLHGKKDVYRRHGVHEYVVWQTHEQRLDWFVLEDGAYLRLDADEDSVLQSRVFPGLHLHTDALLDDRRAEVLDAAQHGTTTNAHADVAEQLARKRDG